VSKLAFFFMTLVGAIPAGGALYALIRNILDRANDIGTVLLIVTIVATVCTALVVLTPFIVLVFYKDTRLPMAPQPQGAAAGAAAAPKKADDDAGFGDAIPDDFDEEELAASADDDEEFGDDVESYDDDDFGDYDEEYEEFDEDEEL
jgi:hypothetical protein